MYASRTWYMTHTLDVWYEYKYERNEKKHTDSTNAWKAIRKINVHEKCVMCVCDMNMGIYVCLHKCMELAYGAFIGCIYMSCIWHMYAWNDIGMLWKEGKWIMNICMYRYIRFVLHVYIYENIMCCMVYHVMDDVYDVMDYMKGTYMSINK